MVKKFSLQLNKSNLEVNNPQIESLCRHEKVFQSEKFVNGENAI